MKSETKQFIRENAVQIYWSLAVLFFGILTIYFNYVLPRSVIPEDLMLVFFDGILLMATLFALFFMLQDRISKMRKEIEDLQEHIERLGFSDREE